MFTLRCINGPKEGLPTIEPYSLVALSYLELLGREYVVENSNSAALPELFDGSHQVEYTQILSYLERNYAPRNEEDKGTAKAMHALADSTLLPLVLSLLYSSTANNYVMRKDVSQNVPWPFNLWVADSLRRRAKDAVEAELWAWAEVLGKTASDIDDEFERRRKRAVFEHNSGTDGFRKSLQEQKKNDQERVKGAFGRHKFLGAVKTTLEPFESMLSRSESDFFCNSKEASFLDGKVASLVSLLHLSSLPSHFTEDIETLFPKLYVHSCTVTKALWGEAKSTLTVAPAPASFASGLTDAIVSSLSASLPFTRYFLDRIKPDASGPSESPKKTEDPKEARARAEFSKKRLVFFSIVAGTALVWSLVVGLIPLPGRPGIWEEVEFDEEEEWIVYEEDGDENDIENIDDGTADDMDDEE